MLKKKTATKKAPDPVIGPAAPIQVEHEAAMAHLHQVYENHLEDTMGHLHNRFEAFISESRLPLPHVLLVLHMLIDETTDQARKKYLGEA